MSKFQTCLKEFADAFEAGKRNNGETFYRIKDSAPEWLQGSSVMMAIHAHVDDRMPDDWIYESARGIAQSLLGYDLDSEDLGDIAHEVADGQVDIYNGARLGWLASHANNADLCDEAQAEFGSDSDDMITRIGIGQYLALSRICDAVISVCRKEASNRE